MASDLTTKIVTTRMNMASDFDYALHQLLTELSQSHDALADRVAALEADNPSIRAIDDDELDEPATATPTAESEESKEHSCRSCGQEAVGYDAGWWLCARCYHGTPVSTQPAPIQPARDAGLMARMAEALRNLCRVSGFSKEYDAARAVLAEYAAGVDERAPV